MKRFRFPTAFALLAALLTTGAGFAQDSPKTPEPAGKTDPVAACMTMMQGAGVTDDGEKAMRDFMQSDRGTQAMAGMMEMARRMGNGDPMLGMTRMMEMMGSMGGGSMGGMMGGQGGMQMPGGQPPSK